MHSKFPATHLKTSVAVAPSSLILFKSDFCKFICCQFNSSERRLRFKLVGQSLGDRWKLKDIDASKTLTPFSFVYLWKLGSRCKFLYNCLLVEAIK